MTVVQSKPWRQVRLHDVALLCVGGTPRRDNPLFWSGTVPWVGTSAINFDWIVAADEYITTAAVQSTSAKVLPAGTIVMAMFGQGATRGKVARLGIDAAVNQACCAIMPHAEVHPAFLYQQLAHRYEEIRRAANSGSQANLNASIIGSLPVVLPPLVEQRRIAEIGERFDAASRLLTRLLAAKRRRKAALLSRVLHEAPNKGKRRTSKWERMFIGELLTESRRPSSTGAVSRKLTVRLYGRGVLAKDTVRPGSDNTQYYRRSAGQFIYSKLDFLNGAFGLVPPGLDGYESTLDLPAFDLSDRVYGPWLLHLFSWPGFYKRHVGLANGGRKARRVNPSDLLKLRIVVPPLGEQRRIADLLDACDREIALLERLRNAYARQKRALLDKLITGEIRLPAA